MWDGAVELVTTPAPLDPVQLRALDGARVEIGVKPPSVASATSYQPDHPWRRVKPGTKLHGILEAEKTGRSDSLTS